jgi:membrane associated rhomboid family serine protease
MSGPAILPDCKQAKDMTDFRPRGFQVLPPVVKNLIIINALFLLASFALEGMNVDLSDYLGLHYWRSSYFQPWQLLTHMFMHGSIAHIFFNMLSLWMFGSTLENMWGPKRFLTFYLVCGLGAALCHLGVLGYQFETMNNAFNAYQANPTVDQFQLFIQKNVQFPSARLNQFIEEWSQNPSSRHYSEMSKAMLYNYLYGYKDIASGLHEPGLFDQATVGASGAVYGILFAFGYLFPNTLLYLYFFVPVKAKWLVAGLIVLELVSGIKNSAGDNIAHFAHLGGMLFAFILLKIWNKRNRRYFY